MWELFVSTRYLFAGRRERFISFTSLISILGIAVGVAALIVVIGVMSGFDDELENKIVGMNAHLIVVSDPPSPMTAEEIDRLRRTGAPGIEGVEAAADFVSGQAIISNGRETMGVLLKGIDPLGEPKVTRLGEYLKRGGLPFQEEGVVVGSELARRLNLGMGDIVSFLSLGIRKPTELKVCGVFTSGMYEYDLNLVITNIKTAQAILGIGDAISGVGLKVDEPLKVELLKRQLQRQLKYPYWVRTWMDMNRNLFAALKLEKVVMFVILALIVLVACFNIASTLMMTVIKKTKDIGILKSIGAPSASIMKIFVLEGFIMGLTGAFIGGIFGLWLAGLIGKYPIIRLFGLEEIYYFDRLPVKVEAIDFILVTAMAVVISLLATIYPAARAARLSPVEALRYE